jgi:hypothetical protein
MLSPFCQGFFLKCLWLQINWCLLVAPKELMSYCDMILKLDPSSAPALFWKAKLTADPTARRALLAAAAKTFSYAAYV